MINFNLKFHLPSNPFFSLSPFSVHQQYFLFFFFYYYHYYSPPITIFSIHAAGCLSPKMRSRYNKSSSVSVGGGRRVLFIRLSNGRTVSRDLTSLVGNISYNLRKFFRGSRFNLQRTCSHVCGSNRIRDHKFWPLVRVADSLQGGLDRVTRFKKLSIFDAARYHVEAEELLSEF